MSDEAAWVSLRQQRNSLLAESDWSQMPDSPITVKDAKDNWSVYRQALRDLPKNTSDPTSPVWPTPPTTS